MQLIEVIAIGVRASIVRLTSLKCPLQWLIFPMVHLGQPAYYEQVEALMHQCDLVLAEGIDSRIVHALTASYRNAAESSRLGAIVQPPPGPRAGGPLIVNADVSGAQFDEDWKQVPLTLRVAIPLLAPLYGSYLRYFAKPEDIHQGLETYDLPSRQVMEAEGRWPLLWETLLHRRDRHLLEEIDEVQRLHSTDDRGGLRGPPHRGRRSSPHGELRVHRVERAMGDSLRLHDLRLSGAVRLRPGRRACEPSARSGRQRPPRHPLQHLHPDR